MWKYYVAKDGSKVVESSRPVHDQSLLEITRVEYEIAKMLTYHTKSVLVDALINMAEIIEGSN